MSQPLHTDTDAILSVLLREAGEILNVDHPDANDYFIDLGGDSLLATIFSNRIEEEFACRPGLEDVLDGNFEQLAKKIAAGEVGAADEFNL